VKRYTASQLRAHLSEALDEVERGGEVAVERGKKTFRIVADGGRRARKSKPARLAFDLHDERLLHGWTWEWRAPGRPIKLRVRAGRARQRG
jgi:antitoxin (DNA-binding transcriptional repressor) of toxin-antitoxin stability system